MELDRVRSNTRLPMLEIEEGNPGDTGTPAQANGLSRPGHLPPTVRPRLSSARRRGRLGDHGLTPRPQDEVQVLVVLWANERDRRRHLEDVSLERHAPVRKRRRPRRADEEMRIVKPTGMNDAWGAQEAPSGALVVLVWGKKAKRATTERAAPSCSFFYGPAATTAPRRTLPRSRSVHGRASAETARSDGRRNPLVRPRGTASGPEARFVRRARWRRGG